MATHTSLNRLLDALVRPEVRVAGRSWSAFHISGYAGLGLAVILATGLVAARGLSPWVMLSLSILAVLTFLGLSLAVKVATGGETLVYYHHQIAVVAACAVALWLFRLPVPAYLDATILGLGLFLACGRVGCLMVGCCHGRPHRLGVSYRDRHVAAGFPSYLAGARLFPIQAVESLWALGLVIVGAGQVLGGRPPGEAFTWYVAGYALGRFGFEFLRGDPDRPYWHGFSEAQWTSLLLVIALAGAGWAGLLPYQTSTIIAAFALMAVMAAIAIGRLFRPAGRLLQARHVCEVAQALAQGGAGSARGQPAASRGPTSVDVTCTSLGVLVSSGMVKTPTGMIESYTLSRRAGNLALRDAEALAELILKLKRRAAESRLAEVRPGIFHLLLFHPRLDIAARREFDASGAAQGR